jgi:SAM-dependent methyltransferase
MSRAQEQAACWAPGARDWADLNEPTCTPFYQAVLDATDVREGTRLLDVGCGGGYALLLARLRGATLAGLDVTEPLLDIARERVPAADLRIGDLESALPFEDDIFDVVTAFNSVQYSADPIFALEEMRRVAKPGGAVAAVVWGPTELCESRTIFEALGPLMPPPPANAPGPVAWSAEGQLEALADKAGLRAERVEDVANPLIYANLATAVRTQLSSGPAAIAIQHSGLPAVRGALTGAFAGSQRPDGTIRQDNVFRYLLARA